MAVDYEATKRIVKNYAENVRRSLPVEKAILYGSYAKGTATELSDIDICFFLRDFGGKRRVDLVAEMLGLSDDYKGIFFEPVVFLTAEIERGNPFVNEILNTGVEI